MKKIFTVKNLAMALSCSMLVGFMVSAANAHNRKDSNFDFEMISRKAVNGPSVLDPINPKKDILSAAGFLSKASALTYSIATVYTDIQSGNVISGVTKARSSLYAGAKLYEEVNLPKAKTKLGLYGARAKYYWSEFKDSKFAKSTAENFATAKKKVSSAFSAFKSWAGKCF